MNQLIQSGNVLALRSWYWKKHFRVPSIDGHGVMNQNNFVVYRGERYRPFLETGPPNSQPRGLEKEMSCLDEWLSLCFAPHTSLPLAIINHDKLGLCWKCRLIISSFHSPPCYASGVHFMSWRSTAQQLWPCFSPCELFYIWLSFLLVSNQILAHRAGDFMTDSLCDIQYYGDRFE